MAPFRPSHVNKRTYPGNANVVGPTTRATCCLTTNTCGSSTNSCAACACTALALGCRCSYCACPCCVICCTCTETVCLRTIPSGMWKSSEQWEASTRDAWSASTCSCGPASCLCCTGVGITCVGNLSDYLGFYIFNCNDANGISDKYFVSPYCTQVSRSGANLYDGVTVATSCMGSAGWFIPNLTQLLSGYSSKVYWDSYDNTNYWSSSSANGCPYYVNLSNGSNALDPGSSTFCSRAFRCVRNANPG